MIGIPIAPRPIEELVERHGGALRNKLTGVVRRLAPIRRATLGELAPFTDLKYLDDAKRAAGRGAFLLVDDVMAAHREDVSSLPGWFHPHPAWALAEMLDSGDVPAEAAHHGEDCRIHPSAVLLPRVRIGSRVTIGPGCVIGAPGFGFASRAGRSRAIPHLAGVVIEDDVYIGSNTTIDAGTLAPTTIKRGARVDSQVHVAHNCEVGEDTIIAAQTGLAGSVIIGRGVLIGGQVGIADHLEIGDGARIAAKSGVIGDVAAGSTVAGYPAVERHRWLRGLAELYRLAAGKSDAPEAQHGGS